MDNDFIHGWLIILSIGVVIAMLLPFAIDAIKKKKGGLWD